MEGFTVLLAASFTEQVRAVTHGSRFSSQDILTALTIALVIGFLIFGWVYFHFRKKREKQDRERLGRRIVSPAPSASAASTDDDSGERRRIRKRRRRRNHRPRNPSLGQTGGLPPPRPEDELPKY